MLIVIALLLAVLVLQACVAIFKLQRIITMSENIDTELSEIDTRMITLTNAVQFAGNKFADLAAKLAAAIGGAKQIGLTEAQLAEFTNIKGELDGAAQELTTSATTADPDPASAGDDSVAAGSGADTVSGPTGDDTTSA